uniref:ubiquitin carboxyl-terminal hydrolase 20-like n=1 Tax=Erigeron canadensis TaxID=72917 RepID=UPI001CB8A2BC|nr:ubiquitin carboxyl-terminal hydrolase 20-like [Erigeron canadensis]
MDSSNSNFPKNPQNSETLISRPNKIDVHATAHKLFDEISQPEGESLMSEQVLPEDSTTHQPQLLSPSITGNGVNNNNNNNYNNNEEEEEDEDFDDDNLNTDDETEAWISCNQNESVETYKPFPSVASTSSGWYEDVYDKPFMVGAGLANLGNTCFFNAVLQCFTHSVLLIQGLYLYSHPTPCDCSNERFCLVCALREHVERSLSSNGRIVSPWKFIDNLNYFSSSFQRYQQEDAHEFLQCFLDRLDSSLSNLKLKDATLPSQNDNLVKQVFGGRVISKLRCCNCNHISDTYEPSVDLSLEIEDANSLSTALESFTKVEHIEDEEMKFTCDQCKQKVSVEKQLMLDQTPPIFAFHLKRFKNDGSYVEKIEKHVEFPLELDVLPYTCGNQNDSGELKYELYAVVVHVAYTSSFGHYYCYIRSAPDTWYKFDDSKVTRVSEADVLSDQAYILFYAKQDTTWFSKYMETYKPSLDYLSNTSPKSVLENVDPSNICSHDVNASRDHPSQSDAVVPLKPIINVIKTSPLNLKEYGSNHRLEAQKSATVTSTRADEIRGTNLEVGSNGGSSTPFLKPNDLKTKIDIDQMLSPSTPPRSPGLNLLDDEPSGVVFAAKPEQLKLVEKSFNKRQRNKEVEDKSRSEAVRQCKRMPGSRGSQFMAVIEEPLKSADSLKKKSKKMASPPRKSYSKSNERFKHYGNVINPASSFR